MSDRSRLRPGREVAYTPTAAEATSYGAGPWPGMITKVNADGTCNLVVDAPVSAVISAATPGAALGAFTDPPSAGEMATLRTRVNELVTLATACKTALNATVKASVAQGGAVGQFSVAAGSDSV